MKPDGTYKVHRIVAATDPGYAVNPQQIEAQVEGSFAYGLSAALFQECTVKDGRIEQTNFHDYTVLRMSDAPDELHVAFVDSEAPPCGLGEIGTPFAGSAVANAFFALTGKRLRHMPFTRERVLEALQA